MQQPASHVEDDPLQTDLIEDKVQQFLIVGTIQQLLAEQQRNFVDLLHEQQMSVARLVENQHRVLEEMLSGPRAWQIPTPRTPRGLDGLPHEPVVSKSGGPACHNGQSSAGMPFCLREPLPSGESLISVHDPLIPGRNTDLEYTQSSSCSKVSDEQHLGVQQGVRPQSTQAHSHCQSSPAGNRCRETMLPIVESAWLKGIMCGAVVLNAVFLICRTHWEMTSILSTGHVEDKEYKWVFWTCQFAFFIIFTAEILMRLAAEQGRFFCGRGRLWNIFELACLFSMVIDIVDFDQYLMTRSVSALRLLRLLRTLRALRLVRSFQFMTQLRMMLLSVVSSFISMLWAVLLLFIIICLFALFLQDTAVSYLREVIANQAALDPKDPVVASLRNDWNGMLQATRSLVYSISGGADWGPLAAPFWTIDTGCGVAYLLFVIFTVIGLLNVLVGIFVQEASDLAKWDKDLVVDAFVQKRKEQQDQMSNLFDCMDLDKTGRLSFAELSTALNQDHIAAYFEHLEVDVEKVEVLFHVLDRDQDGRISKVEFMAGLSKLGGHANAAQVAGMLIEEQNMTQKLERFEVRICQRIDSLQDNILVEKHAAGGFVDRAAS